MDFEVFCDESRPELFSSKNPQAIFLAIGSVWLPSDQKTYVKKDIKALINKHKLSGEIKWNKVGNKNLKLYKDIITYFFMNKNLRFRVILIERQLVDLVRFHQNDAELGFFKFYYQLLHNWILDFNSYRIFLDEKTTRKSDRLITLKKVLSNSNISSVIDFIQALPSEEVLLIQLADLLTGLVNAKFNNQTISPLKKQLITHTEDYLRKEISPTPKREEKFNIFKIHPGGGW